MQIKITDNSSDGVFNYNTSIDRKIYTRLQNIIKYPLGSLPDDNINPIKDFIDTFNGIQDGSIPSNNTNVFIGELGVTKYYPHRDNTYKGELN